MPTILHPDTVFDQLMVTHPDGYEVILVRQAELVHAYRNSCPHIGIGLDYGNGRCLAEDGVTLVCSLHGATFEADTGFCTGGPCAGKALTRLPVRILDGAVVVD